MYSLFLKTVLTVTVSVLLTNTGEASAELTLPGAEYIHPTFDYHEHYGIPVAAYIKETEDRLHKRSVSPASSDSVKSHIANHENGDKAEGSMKYGKRAILGQFPWQAGLVITLTNGMGSACGASLISSSRLLTAGHCWISREHRAQYYIVVLGSTLLYEGGIRIFTDRVIVHDLYNKYSLINDIAIIAINSIEFDRNIQPISLPYYLENESFLTYTAVASGYGQTEGPDGYKNKHLNYAALNVMSNRMCSLLYDKVIGDTNICTFAGNGGEDTCFGDSGGPLVTTVRGKIVLIGITSFVNERCTKAAGFTRVTPYLQWISYFMTARI